MADPQPAEPRGIVVDPRVVLGGGLVALLGVAVAGMFLWMVPKAAEREASAACAGLRSQPPAAAVCGGTDCTLPVAAPDFTALDNNGKPVHLSDFRAGRPLGGARGKVVLVNFWASWCNVCATEKPQLDAMADDLASNDFVVIALASDRTWSDVLVALVKALAPNVKLSADDGKEIALSAALDAYRQGLPDGVPFKVYLDPPDGDGNIGAIAASWGIKAVPESALIDRKGNIRAYFVNKRDWKSPVAETCLRSVIDE